MEGMDGSIFLGSWDMACGFFSFKIKNTTGESNFFQHFFGGEFFETPFFVGTFGYEETLKQYSSRLVNQWIHFARYVVFRCVISYPP